LGSTFVDALDYTVPCTLSGFSKTWLGKELKDIFPHDAVTVDMLKDKNSRFGTLTIDDFPKEGKC
jgi:hypothetical protein